MAAQPASDPGTRQLDALTSLRLFAAFSVLLYHVPFTLERSVGWIILPDSAPSVSFFSSCPISSCVTTIRGTGWILLPQAVRAAVGRYGDGVTSGKPGCRRSVGPADPGAIDAMRNVLLLLPFGAVILSMVFDGWLERLLANRMMMVLGESSFAL